MKNQKDEQVSEEVLNTKEAASLLRLKPKALYQRIYRGQIKGVVRLGNKTLRFFKDELLSSLK